MEDSTRLKHAKRRIEEILKESAYNQPEKYTISWNAEDKDSIVKTQSPSTVKMKALGSDVRLFTAQDSNLNLKKVIDVLKKDASEKDIKTLRSVLKSWNQILNGTNDKSGLSIVLNGEEISSRQLMDLMNNGEIFHLDTEKADKLALFRGNPSLGLVHFNYMMMLSRLVEILEYLQNNYIIPQVKKYDEEKA